MFCGNELLNNISNLVETSAMTLKLQAVNSWDNISGNNPNMNIFWLTSEYSFACKPCHMMQS